MSAQNTMPEGLTINEFNNLLQENPEIETKFFGRPVVYHRRFKNITDLLKHLQDNLKRDKKSYTAYNFYKKELSYICGWDASQERYSQDQYDKTLGRIIRLLGI